ncbi:MAG: hypothetical protein ACOWWH_13455 [Eubacteriaceae bacterium]
MSFKGGFLSKVIEDDTYNLVVSAYIHANPKDLPDYRDAIHTYIFSSYGMYVGTAHDHYDLIDTDTLKPDYTYESGRNIYP